MATLRFTQNYYKIETNYGVVRIPIAELDDSVHGSFIRPVYVGTVEASTLSANTLQAYPMNADTPYGRKTIPISTIDEVFRLDYNTMGATSTSISLYYLSTRGPSMAAASTAPSISFPVVVIGTDGRIFTYITISSTTLFSILTQHASVTAPNGYPSTAPGYIVIEESFWASLTAAQMPSFPRTAEPGVADVIAELFFTRYSPASGGGGDDPYGPGGSSEPGGGGAFPTLTEEGTALPIYTPEQIALRNYGLLGSFLRAYKVTGLQLGTLHSWLWSSNVTDTIIKMFSDPIEGIVGIIGLPVDPDIVTGVTENITVATVDSTISSTRITSQFVDVDCGTLTIAERWAGYLDYNPHTRIQLFLPYIGFVSLNPDDVMGNPVHVVYTVDILTGECLCRIIVAQTIGGIQYARDLYQFTGNVAVRTPISSVNYSSILTSALGASASIAGTAAHVVATGGMTAPLAISGVAATASNVASAKTHVQRSGSLSGSPGWVGIQNPYLVITRPRQCVPENQNTYTGYPGYITQTLGDLSGFTQIEAIHLQDLTATDAERAEIEQLMQGGIIL